MKNQFRNIFFCAAALLGAVACTAEKELPAGAGSESGSGEYLTFTFKGMNGGPITYAESPIATAAEWAVEDLDVYMFEYESDASGLFVKKFASGEYTMSTSGTDRLLKLPSLGNYTADNKTFYFVANPSPTTTLAATGTTTEAVFREQLTVAQAVDGTSGKAALLKTPLLFTGMAANVDPTGAGTTPDVNMIRRVARFDIVNGYPNFVIEKVFVSDANIDGNAFGNATGTPTYASASLAEIEVDDTKYETIDGNRQLRSVFYTYPTTIGANKTKTSIAIQADLNGEGSQLYYVELPADVDVLANYRYKLVVDESITYGLVKFNLHFLDWNDGVEVGINEKSDAMILSSFATDPADQLAAKWDAGTLTYNLAASTATTFTFTVTNPLDIAYSFDVVSGDPADVTAQPAFTSTKTFTYAAKVSHACTVTMPTVNGIVKIRLRVSNAGNATEYEDIFFEWPPLTVPYYGSNTFVGAFWRADQTGERLIRIPATSVGDWTVTVDSYGDFVDGDIVFGTDGSTDAGLTWNAATETPADMNVAANDAKYSVSGGATSAGGTITTSGTNIFFRVGLKSTWTATPDKPARYATLLVTYAGGAETQYVYLRQGEGADFVMRNGDAGTNIVGGARPNAVKFSPYNLTAPEYRSDATAPKTGGADLADHAQPAARSAAFTEYPSQAGAFFQWVNLTNPRYAYHPTNSGVGVGIANWSNADLFGYWVAHVADHETCPPSYRRPKNGITDGSVKLGNNVSSSESRQSLFLNPPIDQSSNNNNTIRGYYADGFFDRRAIVASPNGNEATAVSYYTGSDLRNGQVAYGGTLFYNPNSNASLFFPASGYRNYYEGKMLGSGNNGIYLSSSKYHEQDNFFPNGYAWNINISDSQAKMVISPLSNGNAIRCVHE